MPHLLQILQNISTAIRDIAGEILLRDVEYLMEKYLQRTRKSFSRMFWDQDQASGEQG